MPHGVTVIESVHGGGGISSRNDGVARLYRGYAYAWIRRRGIGIGTGVGVLGVCEGLPGDAVPAGQVARFARWVRRFLEHARPSGSLASRAKAAAPGLRGPWGLGVTIRHGPWRSWRLGERRSGFLWIPGFAAGAAAPE